MKEFEKAYQDAWDYYGNAMVEIGRNFSNKVPYVDVADIANTFPSEWRKIKDAELALDHKDVTVNRIYFFTDQIKLYWNKVIDGVLKRTEKLKRTGMPEPSNKPFQFKICRSDKELYSLKTKYHYCGGITVNEWGMYLERKITVAEIQNNILKRDGSINKGVLIADDGSVQEELPKEENNEPENIDLSSFVSTKYMCDNPPEEPKKESFTTISETDTEVVKSIDDIQVEYQ